MPPCPRTCRRRYGPMRRLCCSMSGWSFAVEEGVYGDRQTAELKIAASIAAARLVRRCRPGTGSPTSNDRRFPAGPHRQTLIIGAHHLFALEDKLRRERNADQGDGNDLLRLNK